MPYDTIRIDNTGPGQKPPYFSGQTPQMRWPDGKIQRESMYLVREVSDRFGGEDLYPSADVKATADKFRDIFPKRKYN